MKVTLLVTGKTDSKWLSEGIDTFTKRLKYYTTLEMKLLPDLKNTRNMPVELQKEKEGQQILDYVEGKSEVYLLDEGGLQFTSRELAAFIDKKMVAACREIVFVIGGPFGFSEKVIRISSGKISLSRLTFSHQMVRLLFVEQLYRSFTIIRGENYHND